MLNTSFAGSTLTTIMVNSHPHVTSIGEGINARIFRKPGKSATYPCSCGTVVGQCEFWQALGRRVRERGVPFDIARIRLGYAPESRMGRRIVSRLPPSAFAPYHAMTQAVSGLRRRRLDDANRALIASALEIDNARLFFLAGKSLFGHYQLMRLPDLDVRFLRIIRDARSFAASYKVKGRSVEDAARVWRRSQAAIDEFIAVHVPKGRVLTIKYEELCRAPMETLTGIHGFFELEPVDVPEVFYPGKQHITGNRIRLEREIRVRSVERWRRVLSADELALVERATGTMNAAMGYS